MYGYVGGSEQIASDEYDSLFTWSGELFYGDDANPYVMIRNLATGFPILFQVSRKTFAIDSEQILSEIRKAFLAQGYDNDAIEAYLKKARLSDLHRRVTRQSRRSSMPLSILRIKSDLTRCYPCSPIRRQHRTGRRLSALI
jgi:hypothetical protein